MKDKVTGFEVGGVDYITNPFQKTEVFARLNTQLEQKKREIEDNNIALKVLLDRHQKACKECEDHMATRLQKLVFPYLDLLQQKVTSAEEKEYLALISAHLDSITESFSKKLTNPAWHLTPGRYWLQTW